MEPPTIDATLLVLDKRVQGRATLLGEIVAVDRHLQLIRERIEAGAPDPVGQAESRFFRGITPALEIDRRNAQLHSFVVLWRRAHTDIVSVPFVRTSGTYDPATTPHVTLEAVLNWVVLVVAPLSVLLWARSTRLAVALVVSGFAMWTCAAVLEHWFLNQPEIFASLLFAYFLLPFVLAPLTGVGLAVLAGPPRHLFASGGAAMIGCIAGMFFWSSIDTGPIVDMRDCWRDMAGPTSLAVSTAGFVAFLAQRRT